MSRSSSAFLEDPARRARRDPQEGQRPPAHRLLLPRRLRRPGRHRQAHHLPDGRGALLGRRGHRHPYRRQRPLRQGHRGHGHAGTEQALAGALLQPEQRRQDAPYRRILPHRALHRRGRVGRRVGQAGARSALPGHPAAQGQDSERREGALRQDARQRRDQDDDRGARLRHRRRGLRHREAPLPPHHHHDRRGRGRLAHPHAAADVLLPAAAEGHRERLHLHRAAAALPRQARQVRNLHQGRARARGVPDQARRPKRASCASRSTGREISGAELEKLLQQDDRAPEVPADGRAARPSARDRRGAASPPAPIASTSPTRTSSKALARDADDADADRDGAARRGAQPLSAARSRIARAAIRGSTRSASIS